MQFRGFGIRTVLLGVGLLALPLVTQGAQAARTKPNATAQSQTTASSTARAATAKPVAATRKGVPITSVALNTTGAGKSKQVLLKGAKARYVTRSYGGLQCVPFARAASGIQLKGNAANWWDAANGVYARGQAPEAGSILNFRANGSMRLGHVAVVKSVLSSREIEIDHANWAGPGASKGGVSRSIPVVDVSANNDWSAVRVGLGHSGNYGSIYPTYGFIYDRPDTDVLARTPARYDEIAEAPVRSFR
jgi:surface antigen